MSAARIVMLLEERLVGPVEKITGAEQPVSFTGDRLKETGGRAAQFVYRLKTTTRQL
jgi:hypothetical protein